MFFPCVQVTPDPKYGAEVVVLLTTLGAKRTEFNAGKRVRDLLEIKKVHHKVVDFNRDARQAGSGEAENQAIQKLMVLGKLQTGENDDLILPQIFIDGQYIGDAVELQGLEDDGFLEGILLRKQCMKCHDKKRVPEAKECSCCWEKFEEILPGRMTLEQTLQELALQRGGDLDDDYGYDEADGLGDNFAGGGSAHVGGSAQASRGAAGGYVGGAQGTTTATTAPPVAPAVAPAPVAAPVEPSGPPPIKVGDAVQYWSDTKNRWVEALVDKVHQKGDVIKYDLNCKKGAAADKVRKPEKA